MKTNCLAWAWRRWRLNPGSYLVIRWTRHNRWRWLRWPHFLWRPKNCPHHQRPCPHMLSFVPDDPQPLGLPPLTFYGHVKAGDDEDLKTEAPNPGA